MMLRLSPGGSVGGGGVGGVGGGDGGDGGGGGGGVTPPLHLPLTCPAAGDGTDGTAVLSLQKLWPVESFCHVKP